MLVRAPFSGQDEYWHRALQGRGQTMTNVCLRRKNKVSFRGELLLKIDASLIQTQDLLKLNLPLSHLQDGGCTRIYPTYSTYSTYLACRYKKMAIMATIVIMAIMVINGHN